MQSTTAATSPAEIDSLLDRKIILATEGFTTKFCELTLKDRKKLSKENALVVAEYIISMKREINPRLSYLRYTIQFLSELARTNSKHALSSLLSSSPSSILGPTVCITALHGNFPALVITEEPTGTKPPPILSLYY
jgi:hypothetical protein